MEEIKALGGVARVIFGSGFFCSKEHVSHHIHPSCTPPKSVAIVFLPLLLVYTAKPIWILEDGSHDDRPQIGRQLQEPIQVALLVINCALHNMRQCES